MTPEEETLKKIKYVLSCGNEAQAIRLIEQYGNWIQEQTEKLLTTVTLGQSEKSDCSCKVESQFRECKNFKCVRFIEGV